MRIYTAAIMQQAEKFFLLHNNKIGELVFPGGKPEKDETAMECAKRELFEETGVRATSLIYHSTRFNMVHGGRVVWSVLRCA